VLTGAALYLGKRRSHQVSSASGSHRGALATKDAIESVNRPGSRFSALRWDQFELLVGEIFRREGYTVELSAALGADDGIDLTLRRDTETILVQCKHWKTSRVATREMREFYGAMAASGAPRGIFVTTGNFTRDAREFAESQGIELMDGAALEESVGEVARAGENLFDVASWVEEFSAQARIFDPECPVCHGAMAIRANRASGAQFWGCRSYPRCPGKRDPRLDLLAITAGR
jgi:restriction system protein